MPGYVTHELGELQAGMIVEVTPEQRCNVFLMDPAALAIYRKGRRGRAVGGPADARVPVRLIVPARGRWVVLVDLGGVSGKIRASVRTLDPTAIDADVTEVLGPRVSARQLLGERR
jgi:hypothetical protein